MKYTILINQKAAVDSKFKLDLIDLAIFDFIKDFTNTDFCTKIKTEDGIYFWISHAIIMREMPLLNIKTAPGIIKRLDKLVKCKLIDKHPDCKKWRKSL